MEDIFKILKQLMGAANILGGVPKPVKVSMTYLAAAVAVLVIFKYAHLGQTEKTFLIIALVLLVVITGGYYAFKAWKEKQKNQQFGGELSQHSSATPRSVSDPGQRARLDDLRKKFQSGVDAYKSRGKDLYKLPWYVIVGEPGSGKTEAIRHSNVGFPPGMQDEFQGVGGTINMNWWFTNQAVLLDTAGRLMFEELKPGETSEWKEFLTLLKKNRPNCPVNGLFLVIPSDSLIKDSADSIQKKAGKIAQQLDVIQRVLDVRFPVFVVITKCDKINGFREFFDGLTDPQLQHQMMGWANPDPLDEPFKPELVDKHLEQVAQRLRRRRLGLMRDPVPEHPEARRTDELDSLYALPHALGMLSSRLRRYLETIFIAGEWSAKPLFLRGIFMSSAMREGAALDAELAEAMGLGVDDLPEGKVWERERAYFLRDLFVEKVFREKGLVTRASNTKRMLRSQQIALYGFGFAGLIAFCALAWFASGNLRSGVKGQGDTWHAVSAAGWDNGYWKRTLVDMRGDGSFASSISTNPVVVDNKSYSLGEFHVRLGQVAGQTLPKNLMFPGLADKYNQNSRKAQRIVFEAGVVRPLVEAARQKMQRDEGEPGSAQREALALAALIQLEADILSRGTGTNTGQLNTEGARTFLSVLENYVASREAPVDTNLVAAMVWTYSTNDTAKGSWAPRWFTGGKGGTNTLAVNVGLNAGLELFLRNATNETQTYLSDWNQISSLRAAVRAFADTERALATAAAGGLDDKFKEARTALDAARKNLDELITKSSSLPVFSEGMSLTNAQHKFQVGITSSAGSALGRIREVNDTALAANKDYPLFRDIKKRLDAIQAQLSSRVAQVIESGDPKEFQQLDEGYLAGNSYASRTDLYARGAKLCDDAPFGSGKLVGLKGAPLEKYLRENIGAARTDFAGYSGRLTNEVGQIMAYELHRAEKRQSDQFFAAYLAEARKQLAANGGFPLVRDLSRMTTQDGFMAATRQLRYISEDLACPQFQKYNLGDRSDEWKRFIQGVAEQQDVAKALLGEDNILGACTITLAGMTDATRADDSWREKWRDLKLVAEGGSGEAVRTQSDSDQKLGEAPVQLALQLQLIENVNAPDSKKFPILTKDWGPLWLIQSYKGQRDRVDPKVWQVEFPVGAPGASGTIRLKLKFERPLPDLEKWPTT